MKMKLVSLVLCTFMGAPLLSFGTDVTGDSILLEPPSSPSFNIGTITNGQSLFFWDPVNHAFGSGRFMNWQVSYRGAYSFAHGDMVSATGTGAVAFGQSVSSGDYSLSFGVSNAAYEYSLLFGKANFMYAGPHVFMFGLFNENYYVDDYAIVLGKNNSLDYNNAYSIAMGYDNALEGEHSRAFGVMNHVYAPHATAIGYGIRTYKPYAFVVGKFNANTGSTGPIFAVGNGNDGNDRSNAFEVYGDGTVNIQRVEPKGGISMGNFGD